MTRSQLLASRLREVLLNGKWIANTNFKEQVQAMTWEQATQKIGGLNTVAMLTFHINYYLCGLLHVLRKGDLDISDKYSFDLPEVKSEKDWADLVGQLLLNSAQFADEVERMSDKILDEPFVDEKYGTYLRNVEGVIEHCYYHLGQVVLIKKMLS